jgi:ATP-binding cassette subfamily B protein
MESPSSPICGAFLSRWVPTEVCWLSKQVRPLFLLHLASFACIAAASLLALFPPFALGWLIDRVLPARATAPLIGLAALLFLSFLGRTLFTNLAGYLTMAAAQKMALGLRMSLVRHLDTLSAEYYESNPVGRVVYPLQEPVEQIAYFGSDLLPSILRLLLTVLFTLAAMLALSNGLTSAVLPLVPIFLITRQHFRRRLATIADSVQHGQVAWGDFLHEHFSAVIPIQLLGQERRQERKAFQLLGRLARSQQSLFKTGVHFTVFTSLSIVLAMSIAVLYGGWSVFTGNLSAGRLVTFYGFIAQLFEPLSGAAEIYARAQKVFANIRQVHNILAERPSIEDRHAAVPLSEIRPHPLEITDMEFRYRRQNGRLRIPSLRILPGEQVALVGENGAGKSTLVKLLMRLYDVKSGSICIGGKDIRNLQLESLRRNVSFLPRDPVLFRGSIASNLRFARPSSSDHELEEVLRRAELSAFLAAQSDGLQQEIGPQGCQLSGGQRQRLAIARALLQQPRILIFDEATSCLDPVSEALVLRNVRCDLPEATLIVVSHRLSTISEFPRVLVLSEGRIVGDGSSDELIDQNETYARLFSAKPAVSLFTN